MAPTFAPSTSATITSCPTECFRSVGEPSATSRPDEMMPTRSAKESASSRYCVVKKMVIPSSAFSLRTSDQTAIRLCGSSPVVGSSRKSTSRVVDEGGGEVKTTLHSSRVGSDSTVDGGSDINQIEDLGESLPDVCCVQAIEPPLERQQLSPGLAVVDRRILKCDADAGSDGLRIRYDVEPRHRGRAGAGPEQRTEDTDDG